MMREETLQEEFENVVNKIDNEGLGYYLISYTDSSSMPDEKSKDLFDKAVKALNNFTEYVEAKAEEEEIAKTKKEYLMEAVDDLVVNLVYYDRKEDEDLSRVDVDEMFKSGDITVEEVIVTFSKELNKYCEILGVETKEEQKMEDKKFEMIKQKWNKLMNDLERWTFLRENQHLGLVVQLDNDNTFVTHKDIEDDYLEFDEYIGWADGVLFLLASVGIKAEPV